MQHRILPLTQATPGLTELPKPNGQSIDSGPQSQVPTSIKIPTETRVVKPPYVPRVLSPEIRASLELDRVFALPIDELFKELEQETIQLISRLKKELEVSMSIIGRQIEHCLSNYGQLMSAKIDLYKYQLMFEPELQFEYPEQTGEKIIYYGMLQERPEFIITLPNIVVSNYDQGLINQKKTQLEISLCNLQKEVTERIENKLSEYEIIFSTTPSEAKNNLQRFIAETNSALECYHDKIEPKLAQDLKITEREFQIFQPAFGLLHMLLMKLINPDNIGVTYREMLVGYRSD